MFEIRLKESVNQNSLFKSDQIIVSYNIIIILLSISINIRVKFIQYSIYKKLKLKICLFKNVKIKIN